MSENNNRSWQPHQGGFFQKCPECFMQFHGRKNQIYCCRKCKARHNNDLAAERKVERDGHTAAYLLNMSILEKVFNEDRKDIVEVLESRLEFEGFDSTAPRATMTYGGENWVRVGDYAYRPIENTDLIEIHKIHPK